MSYPANDPMDPREREVASDEMWHLCADCNAAGAEFRLKRDRYLCDECAARLHAQEIAVIQELLSAPKEPKHVESPAPAQDDEAAIEAWGRSMLVHTVGELESDSTPYFASLVCRRAEKGLGIMRSLASENADLRAKLADAHEQLRCPDCGCATPEEAEAGECGCDSPVCSVEVTTTVAKELCDVAKKLAAAEAHQSDRPLIPGNLIDRIDEHGREWTRTDRVRAAVAELVQPQTVEEITRLREKLAAAEERIAEMRGIAKGFFQWTVHGESTKEMANRMRRVLKRIAELGKGGA